MQLLVTGLLRCFEANKLARGRDRFEQGVEEAGQCCVVADELSHALRVKPTGLHGESQERLRSRGRRCSHRLRSAHARLVEIRRDLSAEEALEDFVRRVPEVGRAAPDPLQHDLGVSLGAFSDPAADHSSVVSAGVLADVQAGGGIQPVVEPEGVDPIALSL